MYKFMYYVHYISATCEKAVFTAQGVIRSPGYPEINYPTLLDGCETTIISPLQRELPLRIRFLFLELESSENGCYDYLEVISFHCYK